MFKGGKFDELNWLVWVLLWAVGKIPVKFWWFFFDNGVKIEFEREDIDLRALNLRKLVVVAIPLPLYYIFLIPHCYWFFLFFAAFMWIEIEFSNTWVKFFFIKGTSNILWTDGLSLGSKDNKLYVSYFKPSEYRLWIGYIFLFSIFAIIAKISKVFNYLSKMSYWSIRMDILTSVIYTIHTLNSKYLTFDYISCFKIFMVPLYVAYQSLF